MMNPIKAGQNILNAKKQFDAFQNRMKQLSATGESKKGLVKVTINGLNDVVDVRIDQGMMDDREELQRHIKDAFNDARKKMEKETQKGIDRNEAMDMLKGMMG